MRIQITGVEHPIGGGRVLRVEGLAIPAGVVSILFGPNGSGKTTLLRILAGTLPGGPGLPVAYLPQRPHLFRGTARRSLLLGLPAERYEHAMALADRLGVRGVLERRNDQLSGGERRRVALARALAGPEAIVALDEPFAEIGAADLPEVRAVVAAEVAGRSTVIVTHDRTDAAALGENLVVLVDGTVRQIGPVSDVLALPGDEVVAGALGTANLLVGTAGRNQDGLAMLETPIGPIWGIGTVEAGERGAALFGAEAVTVYRGGQAEPGSARNHWTGEVVASRHTGRLIEIEVDTGGDRPVVALLTPGSIEAVGAEAGSTVTLAVKAASVRIVRR
jgi:molybdate transport system ATP-binding protein